MYVRTECDAAAREGRRRTSTHWRPRGRMQRRACCAGARGRGGRGYYAGVQSSQCWAWGGGGNGSRRFAAIVRRKRSRGRNSATPRMLRGGPRARRPQIMRACRASAGRRGTRVWAVRGEICTLRAEPRPNSKVRRTGPPGQPHATPRMLRGGPRARRPRVMRACRASAGRRGTRVWACAARLRKMCYAARACSRVAEDVCSSRGRVVELQNHPPRLPVGGGSCRWPAGGCARIKKCLGRVSRGKK